MNQNNQNKTIRTDQKFSVSVALVAATVAILAIGSTSTMAMAHHDHHHEGTSNDNSGQDNGGGIVNGAIRYCTSNLPTCWSILNGLASLL